ncbi:protein NRT1/ PTR FAMILY 5.6 [Capsicum annuum]|uniref:protein NRT1/ PTR FAMILY 5.6 n=1 Tax=Capsicum annuum TaxID=4072 RepID=UPI001FB0F774|nr:protein NRT1/ PTR FAMILY 5.6 [Capsicum annuum]
MFLKYRQAIAWYHKVVFPSKIPVFFSGLIIIHGLVEYGMLAILVTFLTDNPEFPLPKAAQMVNIHEGLSSLLVIVVAELSDSYFGRLNLILFTHTAFILGLGMIWYEAHRQSIIALYGALALLTVGKAGRDVTLKAFLADQLWRRSKGEDPNLEEDQEVVGIRRKLIWRVNWILGIIAATLWYRYSTDEELTWMKVAKVCTMAMVAAFSVFLLGIPFYVRNAPSPSPILYVFNVVKAAILKRRLDYPVSASQLFKNDSTSDPQIFPHIPFLRWLDKAAILEPSSPPIEQAETAGRLFEVAKVKDVKRLISMFPLWSTFFVYSLVQATESTFFYLQADFMDDHLGKFSHVPIVVFVIIKTSTSSSVAFLCEFLKKKASPAPPRRPPLYRILLGMLCSLFCCLTAWRVEVYRRCKLQLWVDDYNNEHYDTIIGMFWLTPQFILAGLMDGLSSSGLQDFFETQVCDSMKGYGPEFSEFATAIGKFFSVMSILIFRPWFKEDVNRSRLDKYYAMLMVPTFLNFCFCCFVSNWYANQQQPHDIDIDMDVNIAQESQEVSTNNQNLGFDIIAHQELEDGPVETVTEPTSSLRVFERN